MRLNKTVIERAWRRREHEPATLRDDEVKGLALVIGPQAGSWRYAYKPRGTREDGSRWPTRTVVLGHLDAMDLEQARQAAGDIKGDVRRGQDPAAVRKAELARQVDERRAADVTLASVLDRYQKWLERQDRSAKHLAGEKRYSSRAVELIGGVCDPRSVKPYELVDALGREAQPAVRRHIYGAVSRMFDWAVARELLNENPALRVAKKQRPKPPAPRRRCPSLDTVRQAWAAADKLPFPTWRDLSRFLLLVPCRTGEIAAMTADQVDLAATVWRQPGRLTKNGEPHLFHLPPVPLALVSGRLKGKAPVFAGERLGRPFNSFKAMLVALQAASGTSGWSWHDLRRAFVLHLAEEGHSEAVLDAILNHRQSVSRGGVMGVYQTAIRAGDQRRAMEAWARLVTGKSAAVVPLRKARR